MCLPILWPRVTHLSMPLSTSRIPCDSQFSPVPIGMLYGTVYIHISDAGIEPGTAARAVGVTTNQPYYETTKEC